MELSEIIPHIEALIFASDKPLTSLEITELINNAFGFMEDKITLDQIESAVEGVIEKYSSDFYPFEVRESGGGWQFLTKRGFHKTVAQLNGDKYLKRLSSASLETLSIIAYKQPITKGEIEAIRGVSTDYSIQKLLEKELILIIGRNEELPGKPLVYATSKNFMDYFGLNSPEDLPKIKEILSDQVVVPTQVVDSEVQPDTISAETVIYDEEGLPMVVSEDGELLERNPEVAADESESVEEESIVSEASIADATAEDENEEEIGSDDDNNLDEEGTVEDNEPEEGEGEMEAGDDDGEDKDDEEEEDKEDDDDNQDEEGTLEDDESEEDEKQLEADTEDDDSEEEDDEEEQEEDNAGEDSEFEENEVVGTDLEDSTSDDEADSLDDEEEGLEDSEEKNDPEKE